MEVPPSNQDGLHRIQMIQGTQEVFGRTLRDYKMAVRCAHGISTPMLKRRHSAIVSPGKRIAQVTHPPRGRREFHVDRGGVEPAPPAPRGPGGHWRDIVSPRSPPQVFEIPGAAG